MVFLGGKDSIAEQHVVLEERWGSRGEVRGQGKTLPAKIHMGGMGSGKRCLTVFEAWLCRGSF